MKHKLIKYIRKLLGIKQPPNHNIHVEMYTICDTCEYLNYCIAEGVVFDNTRNTDSCKHYIRGAGAATCKKDIELLSE